MDNCFINLFFFWDWDAFSSSHFNSKKCFLSKKNHYLIGKTDYCRTLLCKLQPRQGYPVFAHFGAAQWAENDKLLHKKLKSIFLGISPSNRKPGSVSEDIYFSFFPKSHFFLIFACSGSSTAVATAIANFEANRSRTGFSTLLKTSWLANKWNKRCLRGVQKVDCILDRVWIF